MTKIIDNFTSSIGNYFQQKVFGFFSPILLQWTLEIVDLDIVDSLGLVDKILLTIYDFMK